MNMVHIASAPRKQECCLIVGCAYCNKMTWWGASPSPCVFAVFLPEHELLALTRKETHRKHVDTTCMRLTSRHLAIVVVAPRADKNRASLAHMITLRVSSATSAKGSKDRECRQQKRKRMSEVDDPWRKLRDLVRISIDSHQRLITRMSIARICQSDRILLRRT